ncbi:CC0125/CC1285 family lipoprotein [Hyphobacterium sp.]|uniref:CC0125/CC1285 family lipoprotein n=1 Tax=Hyphobacterium sp. TaxID=2004662 RepID=UPI003B51940C
MRILIICTALLVGACAGGPTLYAPANGGNRGYSDQQIEENRFRIRFDGGADVSLRELEDLAFRRAADLTLERGGDWFLVVSRANDGDDQRPVSVGGSVGQTFGNSRFSGSSVGLGVRLNPGAGDKTVFLEIVIGRGPRPDNPQSYDAREVLRWQD